MTNNKIYKTQIFCSFMDLREIKAKVNEMSIEVVLNELNNHLEECSRALLSHDLMILRSQLKVVEGKINQTLEGTRYEDPTLDILKKRRRGAYDGLVGAISEAQRVYGFQFGIYQ